MEARDDRTKTKTRSSHHNQDFPKNEAKTHLLTFTQTRMTCKNLHMSTCRHLYVTTTNVISHHCLAPKETPNCRQNKKPKPNSDALLSIHIWEWIPIRFWAFAAYCYSKTRLGVVLNLLRNTFARRRFFFLQNFFAQWKFNDSAKICFRDSTKICFRSLSRY